MFSAQDTAGQKIQLSYLIEQEDASLGTARISSTVATQIFSAVQSKGL